MPDNPEERTTQRHGRKRYNRRRNNEEAASCRSQPASKGNKLPSALS